MPPKRNVIPHSFKEIDLLGDKAFKIFLSDPNNFKFLVEEIVKHPLMPNELIAFAQNIVFSINGVEIRLDNVKQYLAEVFNVEGQGETSDFPFKRHLAYWSYIYVNTISQGGNYKDICPVTSIVVYRDKGQHALVENAALSGSLICDEDGSLLNLYAINAKKWRDAETGWLQTFLALIDIGIQDSLDVYTAHGINIESEIFKSLYRSIRIAAGEAVVLIGGEENDDNMVTEAKTYLKYGLSEEEKQQVTQQAMQQFTQIISLYNQGYKIPYIGGELGISHNYIQTILEDCGLFKA